MSKKEAQAITSFNCFGYELRKGEGEKDSEMELTKILDCNQEDAAVLVVLNRDGTMKILCPMLKGGICNLAPKSQMEHQDNIKRNLSLL